jgi:hypothetical protein
MVSFLRRHSRKISITLLFCFLSELSGNVAFALTSGPSQPETQQFAPAGMDNMVDPFTGDFSYNIPLMDVGGYPININYASGITPDAEASWVGLGWNLNVGAINRNMRGLPDDFAGDQVVKDYNVKPNQTYGVSGNFPIKIYGYQLPVTASVGLSYNNYTGFGMSLGGNASVSSGIGKGGSLTGSLGVSGTVSSESGLELTPSVGLSKKQKGSNAETTLNSNLSFPFSTREGLKGMTLSGNVSRASTKADKIRDVDIKSGGSFGSNAFMGFSSPTYTPFLENDTYSTSFSTGFNFEFTNPANEITAFGISGFYSGQFLKDTKRTTPAYGYMYSGINQSDDKLMDFNREKDGGYNQFTANLSLTNHTYDVFQVSGQGIGGAYRLYRGDVGSIHDPKASNFGVSPSTSLSLGFGGPPAVGIVGVDIEFNYSESQSGKWPSEREDINNFAHEANTSLNKKVEMAYFKKIGEAAPESNGTFLNDVQHNQDVVRHQLKRSSSFLGDGNTNGRYITVNKNGTQSSPYVNSGNNKRTERQNRNTAFTTLNAKEAANAGIARKIQNYQLNNFNWNYKDVKDKTLTASNPKQGYTYEEIERVVGVRKAHHISEARVTDENGTRYVYGIPAYNSKQEEATFSVAQPSADDKKNGIAKYQPGKDDSNDNKHGLDNMYSRVSTPGYAHSYLLTAILSSDYVDRDNVPGPSDGDLGTYTKFNYTRVIEKFKWRTPYAEIAADGQAIASYTDGMNGTQEDDKGNYVYGEKEIWYLHSIETRTHVAEFYLDKRLDALGVNGKHGGIGSDQQMKLTKIVLYSKPDKWNSKAEPIKVVHFDYDYSLCPHTNNSMVRKDPVTNAIVENADRGKLTLKKIWFTYGNSKKGVLNPYVFNYAQDINGAYDSKLNPEYNYKNYDRWGNYKPDGINGVNNSEFPYAVQKKSDADLHAGVYALSSIGTPTGGTLRVLYESDDYAYVQNKQAMRMFKVKGMVTNPNDAGGNDLNKLYTGGDPNGRQFLLVDLDEGFLPENDNNADQEFKDKYLKGVDLMYHKFLVKVLANQNRYEYIPGYAKIIATGAKLRDKDAVTGRYASAVIPLESVDVKNGVSGTVRASAIVRSAWMFCGMNLNREIMGSTDASSNGLLQVLTGILAQSQQTIRIFKGFAGYMRDKGHCSEFNAEKSFVRLNEPDKIKSGGGHRVKALLMSDNWGLMRSSKEQSNNAAVKQTAYYGQTYNYTMLENGSTISSGVAAYEPIVGGEENPFHRPVFVREVTPLALDKEHFLEEPFGESFFPASTVGYRKVTVTPLKITGALNQNTVFTGNGTGLVEHEFYTAYDFPTITRRTELSTYRHKPNILLKFMKVDSKDMVTCSQGYYIELNDMHGKQKAQRVYPEARETSGDPVLFLNALNQVKPISEVEYRYKTNSDGSLNNKVTYINPDLSVIPESQATDLGTDVDMVQDERYSTSSTVGGGIHVNVKWMYPIPVITPTTFPQINHEETRFRSLVTTKVVNRYAVLESTTAKDNGASITTKNLAWDSKTGKVLLTQVENEFHEPIYNFTYPGHWAYDRFQLSADHEGMTFDANTTTGFAALKTSVLKDGDEVYIDAPVNKGIAYLSEGTLMYKSGEAVTTFSKAKVVRSGSRNMASTPIGSITTLKNPLQTGATQLVFEKVLNAGASEYRDNWKRFCNCSEIENTASLSRNPYVLGKTGNMRPLRSWTYLTERYQSQVNNELNIRKDGYFKDFSPYWIVSNGKLVPLSNVDASRWQYVTEIVNYNSLGMEIENKDALSRYSMAQFGYARNLPVATSNNSQYKETGFDGFEDYDFGDCEDDHFSWRPYRTSVTNKEAHTGRQSIKVAKNEKLILHKVIEVCDDSVNP